MQLLLPTLSRLRATTALELLRSPAAGSQRGTAQGSVVLEGCGVDPHIAAAALLRWLSVFRRSSLLASSAEIRQHFIMAISSSSNLSDNNCNDSLKQRRALRTAIRALSVVDRYVQIRVNLKKLNV